MAGAAEEMPLMSSGNIEGGNIGDVSKMSISGSTPAEIKHGDMAVEEDEKKEWRPIERDNALLVPNLTWEEKVLRVLHMVRCRELIEFNHKLNYSTPTRFCEFNIAFFDLDKESEVMHGPLFHDIPESYYCRLDESINVISIKVAESELSGTINVCGTVLARDQYDYKCGYLYSSVAGRIPNPSHRRFTVSGGDHKSLSLLLPRWNSAEELITKLSPYKMQLKIIWKGVLMQRPNLFGDFGDSLVLR